MKCILWIISITCIFCSSQISLADTENTDQPHFAFGPHATQQRKHPSNRGFSIALEFLPQLTFRSSYLLPMLSLQASWNQLSVLGHAELGWRVPWVDQITPTAQQGQTYAILKDAGSVARLQYRWRAPTMPHHWARELQLIWYLDKSDPFQLGETIETLWSVYSHRISSHHRILARVGARFSWDRFYVESLILLGQFGHITTSDINFDNTKIQTGVMAKLRVRALSWLGLGVDGAYFQQGDLRATGVRGLPYEGWGIHPNIQVHLGVRPSEITFLQRRRMDPRAQRTPIAQRRPGDGISIHTELGIRGHQLQDPEFLTTTKSFVGLTTVIKVQGQWGILQGELQFLWQNIDWLTYEGPGIIPGSLPKPKETTDLFRFSGALAAQVHPKFALAARIETTLPANYTGSLPPPPGGIPPIMSFAIGRQQRIQILAKNQTIAWDVLGIFNARWEPDPFFMLMFECWLYADPNQTKPITGINIPTTTIAATNLQFGTELYVQFRFR